MTHKFVIGIIVNNRFGVLNRVAALFSKRNYNIDSLAVGETESPEYSRMTIVVSGDAYVKEQIVKQLQKLFDVKKISILEEDASLWREHILIKFEAGRGAKTLTEFINRYGGTILDFDEKSLTAEFTGEESQTARFIKEAEGFGILEFCRSGIISLGRGAGAVMDIKNIDNH